MLGQWRKVTHQGLCSCDNYCRAIQTSQVIPERAKFINTNQILQICLISQNNIPAPPQESLESDGFLWLSSLISCSSKIQDLWNCEKTKPSCVAHEWINYFIFCTAKIFILATPSCKIDQMQNTKPHKDNQLWISSQQNPLWLLYQTAGLQFLTYQHNVVHHTMDGYILWMSYYGYTGIMAPGISEEWSYFSALSTYRSVWTSSSICLDVFLLLQALHSIYLNILNVIRVAFNS